MEQWYGTTLHVWECIGISLYGVPIAWQNLWWTVVSIFCLY